MALYFISKPALPDTRLDHLYIDNGKGCDLVTFERKKGDVRIVSIQNFDAPFYKLNIHRYLKTSKKAVGFILSAVEQYLMSITISQTRRT